MVSWEKAKVPEAQAIELSRRRGIPRPVAMSLLARGLEEGALDGFLSPKLGSLSDPYDLPGTEKAAQRIWQAISGGERILVYGDYDTDGITATTVVTNILSQNNARVSSFLPHRFDDGYGFTVDALQKAMENKEFGLIITVDCGMTGKDSVELAGTRGIDVIVSDHHEPDGTPPGAYAVVNPRLHGNGEAWSHLAGVGVAFKLCHGFVKYGREHGLGAETTDVRAILDLVALGTVADIVPLLAENRILVSYGLRMLEAQTRPGVRALCEMSGIESKFNPSHISFGLAPLINAAGRFGSAEEAFRILNTDNIVEAHELAESLQRYNLARKKTENEIFDVAVEQIESIGGGRDGAVLAAGEGWHLGVVGIVASRLARVYNVPALVLSIEGETARGSGRSIGDFNLVELLNACSGFLARFGGHPMAAGLSLKTSNIEGFRDAFREAIATCGVKAMPPVIDYDGEVKIRELDGELFDYLGKLAPFGYANPEPVYRFNELSPVNVAPAAVKHSRGTLMDDEGNAVDFIAFNTDISELPRTERWDVLASPQINSFRGMSTTQLHVKAVRAGGLC